MTQIFNIFHDQVHICNIAAFLLHLTLTAPPCRFPPSAPEPREAGTCGSKPFASPSAAPPAASSNSTLSDAYAGRAAGLPAEVGQLLNSLFTCKAAQLTAWLCCVHILFSLKVSGSETPRRDSTRRKRPRHTGAACCHGRTHHINVCDMLRITRNSTVKDLSEHLAQNEQRSQNLLRKKNM